MVVTIILASVFVALPANASTYTYDNLNRLTSVTYDNGQKVIYTYDVAGNILEVNILDSKNPPKPGLTLLQPFRRQATNPGP